MVFRGKPSKACHACRKRRIRCDLARPGCHNCDRIGKPCPGYRDPTDLMFCDQREVIERRIAAKQKKAVVRPKCPYCTAVGVEKDDHSKCSILEVLPNLLPPLDDIAMAFFVKHFVVVDGNQTPNIKGANNPNDPLWPAMRAIGLAGFANHTRTPRLLGEARRHYVEAIGLTNKALQSPEDAREDHTLLAVMNLTTFETLCGRDLSDWISHINGSASLMHHRGTEQFAWPGGLRLFSQTVVALAVKSMQQAVRVPQQVVDLLDTAEVYADSEYPTWRYTVAIVTLANFKADVLSGRLSDFDAILAMAEQYRHMLSGIFDKADSLWEFEDHVIEQPSDLVFSDRFHIYSTQMSGQIWNATRCLWIQLQRLTREVAAQALIRGSRYSDNELYNLIEDANKVIKQSAEDIFASAPQHMGYIKVIPTPHGRRFEFRKPDSTQPFFPWSSFPRPHQVVNPALFKEVGSPMLRAQGGYSFMWMALNAGMTDLGDGKVRAYAAMLLSDLAHRMGAQQALALSRFLQSRVDLVASRSSRFALLEVSELS